MRRFDSVLSGLLTLLVLGSLTGCVAAAAGFGTAKALEGDDAYVCRDAPNAETKDGLQTRLEEGSNDYPNRKSDSDNVQPVTIESTEAVAVGDETRNVARVSSQVFDGREYWIVESALCQE